MLRVRISRSTPAADGAWAGTARPDPRPGRRRARFALLLPALALLLGALSLFDAAPAQAQTIWVAGS